MNLGQWIAELKRRRVFRALAAYAVVVFAVLQVAEPLLHGLGLPEWVLKVVVVALLGGFPLVAGGAWVFDLTLSGVQRVPAIAPTDGATAVPVPAVRGRDWVPLLLVAVLAAGVTALASYGVLRVRGASAAPEASTLAPSIAVLPFDDLTPGKDQGYFADGVAEEILGALARIEGLKVIGRTSSFAFKGKPDDLATIARKLGVATVLEGSVRRAGMRVRVAANLVRAADGATVWTDTVERDATDLFATEDEIARRVAAALRIKLLARDRGVAASRATGLPEAQDRYLLGLSFMRQGSREGYRRAREAFRRAVSIDPQFAAAQARLSDALWGSYLSGDAAGRSATLDLQRGALAAAERAIELDPDLANGYWARGRVRWAYGYDGEGAKADFERALALSPGDPDALRSLGLQLTVGRQRGRGIDLLRRSAEADPLWSRSWMWLGFAYLGVGDVERGRSALARAVEIAPDGDWEVLYLAMAHLLEGNPTLALAGAERNVSPWVKSMIRVLAHHALGNRLESDRALRELQGHAHIVAYQIAEAYAWRGEVDRSFEWLDRCREDRDGGFTLAPLDPLLRPLHGDPRWKGLLATLKLPGD